MSFHSRLDIDYWKTVFSVTRLQEEAHGTMPSVNIISGPYDIAVLEQLRAMSYAYQSDVKRVATDLFIWFRGEPEQRMLTKIGGLPYRLASKDWPLSSSGVPLTFVAQLCFLDSRDLAPPLPGDVLLIFTEARNWGTQQDPLYDFMGEDVHDSYLYFEWISQTDEPLITHEQVPETGLSIISCYAAIHRTWDYREVDGFAYPDLTGHIPPIFQATKIGGVCPGQDEEYENAQNYLCTLSSLANNITKPFSFLNVPNPMSWQEWLDSKALAIGDVGFINIFFDKKGEISWSFHG